MRVNRGLGVSLALVIIVVATGLIAGKSKAPVQGAPTLISFGSKVKLPAGSQLDFTNGWVAANSANGIGVYAGSESGNRNNGRLLVVRSQGQKLKFHPVVLRGSGAVMLLKPARPASESAALGESVRFVTANGGMGTLNLADGKASLSSG